MKKMKNVQKKMKAGECLELRVAAQLPAAEKLHKTQRFIFILILNFPSLYIFPPPNSPILFPSEKPVLIPNFQPLLLLSVVIK